MPKIEPKASRKKWIAVGVASIIFFMGALSVVRQAVVEENHTSTSLTDLFNQTPVLQESIYYGTDLANRIAIIRIDGTIQSGATSALSSEGYNHQATFEMLTAAASDPTVKGLILAINSPGGGVYESAELRDYIQMIKTETGMPIYASFGSVSASGGYYISAETDKIFAARETVTGSIGVIMSNYNFSGLMEKIGIHNNVIKSGAMKDMLSSSREMTQEEYEWLQSYIDDSFERFLEIVMNGRKMTREQALAVADGRIFSGNQALEVGLIDEIGYEEDAISGLAADLGVEDPVVFEYIMPKTYAFENFLPFGMNFEGKNSLTSQVSKLWQAVEEQQIPKAQYLYRGGH